jgi:NAD(P)-dependent dehydrogenase (short-subunit alcohol dehydrogenase family)
MDLGLNGRRALVTGASKGIGLAITRALVARSRLRAGARAEALPARDGLAVTATSRRRHSPPLSLQTTNFTLLPSGLVTAP